ncbi:DivIVA domain-containing protein [Geodermatophilus sp. YIM 151500]|uniref:DivIVA domain-containing protein n=1 Tax=Geodermatophilus sp. YIM 151500 TaxID=2984531 RepID=UPI0021E4F952|nr:DivIVA domain-containing protein [Geodermatophilus sp. YIM 151500]MCV2489380.1 DivIVA domain-containing protein [Geodermatophilus sp. YIM 151500]
MLGFLASVVGVLLVAGLLFLGASVLLGRGETQPPAELDRSPVELPDDRPVTGDDVRALTLSVTVRGYRMTEVDWLLDRFAQALDERDLELALLRGRLRECEEGSAASSADSAAPGGAPDGDGAAAGPQDPTAEHGERTGA